jgi:cytochrome c oxidase cbb3-type subunit 2
MNKALVVFSAIVCVSAAEAWSSPRREPRPSTSAERLGREVYRTYCIGCHGQRGDGKGPAAPWLDPRPRDFTPATFKWRSTPSGALPTDDDLRRTIRKGVHNASMPSWPLLPDREVDAVIQYLKLFSARWKDPSSAQPAMSLPGAPSFVSTPESVERGRMLYEKFKCGACHGPEGHGDGFAAAGLTDDWGFPIRPFDFTRGTPKGGDRPEDFYRGFTTGLSGTPMPSFASAMSDQERWDVVSFVMDLRRRNAPGKTPSTAGGNR